MKLVSDIDVSQTKRIFEVLYSESEIFEDFSQDEVQAMAGVFKLLQFHK